MPKSLEPGAALMIECTELCVPKKAFTKATSSPSAIAWLLLDKKAVMFLRFCITHSCVGPRSAVRFMPAAHRWINSLVTALVDGKSTVLGVLLGKTGEGFGVVLSCEGSK